MRAPAAESVGLAIARRLADESLSEASLCSVVGWDVGQALHDPEALDSYSVLALRDICRAVGREWVDVVLWASSRPTMA